MLTKARFCRCTRVGGKWTVEWVGADTDPRKDWVTDVAMKGYGALRAATIRQRKLPRYPDGQGWQQRTH